MPPIGRLCDLHSHTHQRRAVARVEMSSHTWISRLCTTCTLTWLYDTGIEWQVIWMSSMRGPR